MENKKIETLNMKELEELSIYGGNEGEASGRSAVLSTIVGSMTLSEAVTALTAVSSLSVAVSELLSCAKKCK